MSLSVSIALDADSLISTNTSVLPEGQFTSIQIEGISIQFDGFGVKQRKAAERLLHTVEEALRNIPKCPICHGDEYIELGDIDGFAQATDCPCVGGDPERLPDAKRDIYDGVLPMQDIIKEQAPHLLEPRGDEDYRKDMANAEFNAQDILAENE